jgi:hypothetical protein
VLVMRMCSCTCAHMCVLVSACVVHRTRVHTTGEPEKGKNAHNSPACTPAARLHAARIGLVRLGNRFSFRARGRAARLHARLHARQLLVTRRCSYARSRCCTEQEYTLPEKQRRAKTRTSNRCSRCVAVALMTKQTHLSVLFKADAI